MMKKLALILAFVAASPALAQEGVIGSGITGGIGATPPAYSSALGVQFSNSQLADMAALNVPTTGACQGTMAFRVKGMYSASSVGPTIEDDDFLGNFQDPSGNSSEAIAGGDIALDANGMRLNLGDITHTINQSTGNHANYIAPVLDQDTWDSYIWSWNYCTSTQYQALYKNGAAVAVTSESVNYTAPMNVAWNASLSTLTANGGASQWVGGFIIGMNGTSYPLTGNPGYFDFDDFVLDTQNSVLTCDDASGLGHSIAAGTCVNYSIHSGVLNSYYANGKPVRINKNSNCNGLTGVQPALCFTTDGGGASPTYSVAKFQTNQGAAGGTWTATGVFAPSGLPPSGLPAGMIGEVWNSEAPYSGNGIGTATSAIATSYDNHAAQAGDLLLLTATTNSNTTYPSSCPSGWAAATQAPGGTPYWMNLGDNYTANQKVSAIYCYRVVGCGTNATCPSPSGITASAILQGQSANGFTETAPAVSLSTSTATYYSWAIVDYRGVDPANPIDTFSVVNSYLNTATQQVANTITSYPNETVVELMAAPPAGQYERLSASPTGANWRGTGDVAPSGGAAPMTAIFDATQTTPGMTTFASMTLSGTPAFNAPFTPLMAAIGLKPAGVTETLSAGALYGPFYGNGSIRVPASATTMNALCFGAGGDGSAHNNARGGAGGGYSETDGLSVSSLQGQLIYYQTGQSTETGMPATGNGSTPAPSWVNISANSTPSTTANGCAALAGQGGSNSGTPYGGNSSSNNTGMVGTITYAGGNGGAGSGSWGGGGGGGASSGGPGSVGGASGGSAGGASGPGGTVGTYPGGAGGTGVSGQVVAQTSGAGTPTQGVSSCSGLACAGGGGGGNGAGGYTTNGMGSKGGVGSVLVHF